VKKDVLLTIARKSFQADLTLPNPNGFVRFAQVKPVNKYIIIPASQTIKKGSKGADPVSLVMPWASGFKFPVQSGA
jgi:hypothetical protein